MSAASLPAGSWRCQPLLPIVVKAHTAIARQHLGDLAQDIGWPVKVPCSLLFAAPPSAWPTRRRSTNRAVPHREGALLAHCLQPPGQIGIAAIRFSKAGRRQDHISQQAVSVRNRSWTTRKDSGPRARPAPSRSRPGSAPMIHMALQAAFLGRGHHAVKTQALYGRELAAPKAR